METEFNLERLIPMAQRLSAADPKAPILVREDSSFDSMAQMLGIEACNQPGMPRVDWLIKWNPRKTDGQRSASDWMPILRPAGTRLVRANG